MNDIDFTVAGTQPIQLPPLHRQIIIATADMVGANLDRIILAHDVVRDCLMDRAIGGFNVLVAPEHASVPLIALTEKIMKHETVMDFRDPEHKAIQETNHGRGRRLKLVCHGHDVNLTYLGMMTLQSAAEMPPLGLSSVAANINTVCLTQAFIADRTKRRITLLGKIPRRQREKAILNILALTSLDGKYNDFVPMPDRVFSGRSNKLCDAVPEFMAFPS